MQKNWILIFHRISAAERVQGLRYGVSDGTFETKKKQPKLIIQTMYIKGKTAIAYQGSLTCQSIGKFSLFEFEQL